MVEHCYFRDFTVGRVARAVVEVDFNYEEGADGRFRPALRDVVIERLTSQASRRPADLQGLPGAPAENILFRNCTFDGAAEASVVRHVRRVRLENVTVNGVRIRSL